MSRATLPGAGPTYPTGYVQPDQVVFDTAGLQLVIEVGGPDAFVALEEQLNPAITAFNAGMSALSAEIAAVEF